MKITTIAISVLIFLSCKHQQGTQTLQIKNTNGELNVLSYRMVNTDTVLEGTQKYYWQNGRIRDAINFLDGVKNGLSLHYDSLGILRNKSFYKNGKEDSISSYYSPNSRLSAETFFIEGVKVFTKGTFADSVLPSYEFYRSDGYVQYVVLFDSAGNKVYENGFIFGDSIQSENNLNLDSLRINSTVKAKILTTKLPGYTSIILLDYFDNLNRKAKIDYQVRTEGFYTYIKFTPIKIGRATLVLIGELRDEKNILVKRDTLFTKIKVTPM
jgi:hypothetical protein